MCTNFVLINKNGSAELAHRSLDHLFGHRTRFPSRCVESRRADARQGDPPSGAPPRWRNLLRSSALRRLDAEIDIPSGPVAMADRFRRLSHCSTSSTRRFLSLPASDEFAKTGARGPTPWASSRSPSIPKSLTRVSITVRARAADSFWLYSKVPFESV